MLRKDLLGAIKEDLQAKGLKITKEDLGTILDSTLNTIGQSVLLAEESVKTVLGTFKLSQSEARVGHNPKTGEKINLAPRRKVVFTPSKDYNVKVEA